MSLFTEVEQYFEYLYQIRKAEDYLLIEFLFPSSWKVPKKYLIEDKFMNNGHIEDKIHISFIAQFNKEEVELTNQNIVGIINFNLEREEKQRLLDSKINELKSIFEKETLDSLKVLKFDIKAKKVKNEPDRKLQEDDGLSSIIAEEG